MLLKALFELRALSISGFMPDLIACAGCGCFTADRMFFYPNNGVIYCENCSTNQKEVHISLTPGALAAMRHILYSPTEKLFAFTIDPESIHCLNDASERFLQSQTERSYQSLEFFHSIVSFG